MVWGPSPQKRSHSLPALWLLGRIPNLLPSISKLTLSSHRRLSVSASVHLSRDCTDKAGKGGCKGCHNASNVRRVICEIAVDEKVGERTVVAEINAAAVIQGLGGRVQQELDEEEFRDDWLGDETADKCGARRRQ